jgi:hemerythrin
MVFLQWNQQIAFNNEELDKQRMGFLEYVNTLQAAVINGDEQNSLGGVLDEFTAFSVVYFEREEDLFIKHNYSKYLEHKQEHDDLIRKLIDLQEQFIDQQIMVCFNALDYSDSWLSKHNKEYDRDFMLFDRQS